MLIKMEVIVDTDAQYAIDLTLDSMINFTKDMEYIFRDNARVTGTYTIGVQQDEYSNTADSGGR